MGLALYRYGAIRQDANLILEAARLLQRANQNNPDDYDVLVSLGHAFYDAASIRQENHNFLKAREYYRKALEQKPDDAEIRADYGSTYFLADPADFEKALGELQKALQTNPKSERTLQLLIQAFIKQKNLAEAEKYLANLKEVNPNNIRIPDLTNEINQMRR
jgi:tetratricopeptide (TPR) repeat protein